MNRDDGLGDLMNERTTLRREAERLKNSLKLTREQQELIKRRKELVDKCIEQERATRKDLNLTNHAIVRYFERVLGLDIESIKRQIVTSKLLNQYQTCGNGKYPVEVDGKKFQITIRGGAIVTVLPP